MLKPIFVALILITASCSNNQSQNETKETPHATEANHARLQLNNGKKWKLDEATRKNIQAIKTHISEATHVNVLSGEELQKHADKLIKDCRMSGPDHDALHTWLVPFLQHVQALKTNRDAEAASHALNEDLKEFDIYFE